ncbi:MAG: aquaporin [Candidatus Curtissbacteria bacterium]|nr:aquaporin [Candidatus Curtissbacteria bacterium]
MQSLIKNLDWRAYAAEFLGTFAVVFVSCGAVLSNKLWGELGLVGVALACGLVVAVAMYSTVHISGGHLNPAITLALWLDGKIQSLTALVYILSQIVASFVAAGVLLFIFGNRAMEFSLGSPEIASGVSFQSAVVLEVIITALLIFAYFSTMVNRRGPVSFGPFVVGLTVLVSVLVASAISGGSTNPARVVGPLTIAARWDVLVLYVIGAAGGSLFGIVYDFVFLKKSKK